MLQHHMSNRYPLRLQVLCVCGCVNSPNLPKLSQGLQYFFELLMSLVVISK